MVDFVLPLRGVQFVFAVISLGLNGYVCHWFNDYDYYDEDSPSRVNFMIFVSLWTLLVLLYLGLAPLLFPRFSHHFVVLGLDAITMLFWFSGFIALSAYRGDLALCSGRVCDSLTAACVFGAFEWVLFVITTIFAALGVFRGHSGTSKPAAHTGGEGVRA